MSYVQGKWETLWWFYLSCCHVGMHVGLNLHGMLVLGKFECLLTCRRPCRRYVGGRSKFSDCGEVKWWIECHHHWGCRGGFQEQALWITKFLQLAALVVVLTSRWIVKCQYLNLGIMYLQLKFARWLLESHTWGVNSNDEWLSARCRPVEFEGLM